MKILSSKARETVTLGNPVSHDSNGSSQELRSVDSDHSVSSLKNDVLDELELHSSKDDDSCVTPSHIEDKNDKNHHFVPLPSTIKHAPKKIVSIKETVEDIDSIMKERRKNKGAKKSKSFDFDNEYDGSLKPTRSILKVGSLNDKSDLLNSLNCVE